METTKGPGAHRPGMLIEAVQHLRSVLRHLLVIGDGAVGNGELISRTFACFQLQHGGINCTGSSTWHRPTQHLNPMAFRMNKNGYFF